MATCTATTKKGTPCQNKAKGGEELCAVHLGTATRPSKLRDAMPKIVEALEIGNSREGAARYAGVGVSTFYRWMEVGEADVEKERETDERELREAVTRAEGFAEQALVAEVRKSATGFVDPNTRKREGKDWRAAAFLLERRYRRQWGQHVEVDHSGGVRVEQRRDLRRLSDEQLDELDRLLGAAEEAG